MGLGAVSRYRADWIHDDLSRRHLFIEESVDERGIGAVLQQAAHEVSEELLVGADWRVHAHRRQVVEASLRLVIEQRTHAVQALELIYRAGVRREFQHRRQRMRVVRRELRKQVPAAEQPRGTGDIGEVRRRLAGVHRVGPQPFDLGALYLEVPIRSLYEPHHDRPAETLQPVDDGRGPFRIRLHRDTEPVPGREVTGPRHTLEQQQGQLQALGLLRIDSEVQTPISGFTGEVEQPMSEFVQHPLFLQRFETRMQRR